MATGQPCSSPKATTSSGEAMTSVVPGTPGHLGPLGGDAGADLVAHDLDGLGRRPDPGDALASVMARAKSVFSEKKP